MKKLFVLLLVLLLVAVPVSASGDPVYDGEELLTAQECASLQTQYADFAQAHDFSVMLMTVYSFEGRSAQDFAGKAYDRMGFPQDGILYLVSLTEGEWYILTNGQCNARIPDWLAEDMGEDLVEYLRDGSYYEAFSRFPALAEEAYNSSYSNYGGADAPAARKNYGKTIVISMVVGIVIGLIAVGIMAYQMRSVRAKAGAREYVRPGSMQLQQSRDIFLYSRVTRKAKPKSSSSSSGRGGGGGGRGGAGGRI